MGKLGITAQQINAEFGMRNYFCRLFLCAENAAPCVVGACIARLKAPFIKELSAKLTEDLKIRFFF